MDIIFWKNNREGWYKNNEGVVLSGEGSYSIEKHRIKKELIIKCI